MTQRNQSGTKEDEKPTPAWMTKLHEVQELFAAIIPADVSLSEELLAERREEARRESEE